VMDNRFGGVEFDQRIYMNNVLDYDGYRLFQSSYDQDEHGTILSVNHDWWGTGITYAGYALMMVGMVLTLISRKSRFVTLIRKITDLKVKSVVILFITALISSSSVAQHNHNAPRAAEMKEVTIDLDHSEKFSRLLVQDQAGRIKPIHTMASEIVRKVTGKEEFNWETPTQVFIGMMYNPVQWRNVAMIKVYNPELEEKLGATDHYISFVDLFDENFNYKLGEEVEIAKRKKPAEQSKYDKEVLKVDERANICFMVYQGAMLRVFPKFKDPNHSWFTSTEYQQFDNHDSLFVKAIIPLYFSSVSQSVQEGNWAKADSVLKHISDYQMKFGGEVLPPQKKIDLEIRYNKMQLFKKLFRYYALVGFIMLVLLFIDIVVSVRWIRIVVNILTAIMFLMFLMHAAGLAIRWYVSDHAPWSNGYEAMIYIAFVTVLVGFIFARMTKIAVAATAILASLILMVAHLNFMDPEITPLVPVLKSYWLMIHVAVITGSYAFLGFGAILGLMNLILLIFTTTGNKVRISRAYQMLTYINEMTVTIGLFMAAIGTFLGGVWANESWGRYWGWDPKETWALVIVLFYAMLLHLRFIPKANGKFLFNTLSLFGFSTVIMTYFGVNYYLSGLHSYAKGDPVPIPTYVPITLGVAILITIIAYIRNKKMAAK
ncbi:MAG: cytochrome c biogenesis protein CcsA, partial [Flavobacteriales bacterium]|nr:cytochrome c biogenesis protein CcsA [Flavobacteriales bacterium]